MTQKELLYMEDAIGHEQNLAIMLTNFSGAMENSELKNYLEKLAKKHQSLEGKLLKVMEEIANEG